MAAKLTIGFLGAGKMATALAQGFIRAGIVTAEEIIASDLSAPARASFTEQTGARSTESNCEVTRFAQAIILAVKPDQIATVVAEIGEEFTDKQLLMSI